MSNYHRYIVIALSSSALAVGTGLSLYAANAFAQQEERADAALNQLVHEPPTMEDLEDSDLHPELKKVIRYGYDLFTNTQQLRGEYVFNDMNCSSCHLGEGRVPFSAPVWAAAITLPDFRGKNQHVNNLEERIAGCFAYSMNGTPPEYGSDEMLALSAYHQWLATGAPMYPDKPIYGRGFPAPEQPETPSYARGEAAYQENCAICHQEDANATFRAANVAVQRLAVQIPFRQCLPAKAWRAHLENHAWHPRLRGAEVMHLHPQARFDMDFMTRNHRHA